MEPVVRHKRKREEPQPQPPTLYIVKPQMVSIEQLLSEAATTFVISFHDRGTPFGQASHLFEYYLGFMTPEKDNDSTKGGVHSDLHPKLAEEREKDGDNQPKKAVYRFSPNPLRPVIVCGVELRFSTADMQSPYSCEDFLRLKFKPDTKTPPPTHSPPSTL